MGSSFAKYIRRSANNGSTWGAWVNILSQQTISVNNAAGSGSYYKFGSLLICWGYATITPSAANTATTSALTFKAAFSSAPVVVVGLGAQPAVDRTIMSATSITTTGFTLHANFSNTTTRGAYWIAIGKC